MSRQPCGWPTTSNTSRGYGWEWEKQRKLVLKRDRYLCQCPHCKAEHRVTVANQVDHIVPRAEGGTDDLSNLRAINAECHRRITCEQQGRTWRDGNGFKPPRLPTLRGMKARGVGRLVS